MRNVVIAQYKTMQQINNPTSHLVEGCDSVPTVAIYWDFENVRIPKQTECLVTFAQEQGRLVSQKVYSHWRREPLKFRQILDVYNFEQVDVIQEGKNSADRALIDDCYQEAMRDRGPDVFILLSGDEDFVPLVQKLKQTGKRVIAIGFSGISHIKLRHAVNQFYYAEQLCQPAA